MTFRRVLGRLAEGQGGVCDGLRPAFQNMRRVSMMLRWLTIRLFSFADFADRAIPPLNLCSGLFCLAGSTNIIKALLSVSERDWEQPWCGKAVSFVTPAVFLLDLAQRQNNEEFRFCLARFDDSVLVDFMRSCFSKADENTLPDHQVALVFFCLSRLGELRHPLAHELALMMVDRGWWAYAVKAISYDSGPRRTDWMMKFFAKLDGFMFCQILFELNRFSFPDYGQILTSWLHLAIKTDPERIPFLLAVGANPFEHLPGKNEDSFELAARTSQRAVHLLLVEHPERLVRLGSSGKCLCQISSESQHNYTKDWLVGRGCHMDASM